MSRGRARQSRGDRGEAQRGGGDRSDGPGARRVVGRPRGAQARREVVGPPRAIDRHTAAKRIGDPRRDPRPIETPQLGRPRPRSEQPGAPRPSVMGPPDAARGGITRVRSTEWRTGALFRLSPSISPCSSAESFALSSCRRRRRLDRSRAGPSAAWSPRSEPGRSCSRERPGRCIAERLGIAARARGGDVASPPL